MSRIWNEVAVLEDPSLRSLVPDLLPGLVYRNQVQVGLVEMARVGVFEDASRIFLRSLCILRFLLRSLLTIALRAIRVYPL